MPSTIHLQHYQQEFDYSCVAACARMVLARLGQHLPEFELRKLLKTRPSTGTHPLNFRNLESLGVEVIWPYPATMADVQARIDDSVLIAIIRSKDNA